jgi:UTP-glucose-1-phosphate uridylyltransferase
MRKAVIPAAGLGTRFLPATKAMPQGNASLIDRPAIQYVVEEAVRAGLTDIVMITGRNKRPLEDHFDREPFLEQTLATQGDHSKLAAVQKSSMLADIHYLRQGDLSCRGDFGQRNWWILLRCQCWLLITIVDFVGPSVTERGVSAPTVVKPSI